MIMENSMDDLTPPNLYIFDEVYIYMFTITG